jgi:hypothetical protein
MQRRESSFCITLAKALVRPATAVASGKGSNNRYREMITDAVQTTDEGYLLTVPLFDKTPGAPGARHEHPIEWIGWPL